MKKRILIAFAALLLSACAGGMHSGMGSSGDMGADGPDPGDVYYGA